MRPPNTRTASRAALLLVLLLLASRAGARTPTFPRFHEVSEQAGLGATEGDKTASPAVGDLDGNGYAEIVMCNHARGPFEVFWGSKSGFDRTVIFQQKADKHGVAIGDYNGDGLPDIVLSVAGGKVQYPSQPVLGKALPNSSIERVEGFEANLNSRVIRGVSVRYLDADKDGDLDLFILGRKIPSMESRRHGIFENLGNSTFVPRPNNALEFGLSGGGHLVADYNNDGYQDIFVFSPAGLTLFMNDGNWKFIDVSETALPKPYKRPFSGGVQLDYDNDGDMDFYFGGGNKDKGPYFGGADVMLENRNGKLVDVSEAAHVPTQGVHPGITAGDFNNDGWVDVFIPRAGPGDERINDQIMLNRGDGSYQTIVGHGSNGPHDQTSPSGAQAFDYNNDGLIDLVVGSRFPSTDPSLIRGRMRLFENRTPGAGNYFVVSLPVMSKDGHTTMDAIVVIVTASGTSYTKIAGSVGEGRVQSFISDVHFGIGSETRVRSITVTLSTEVTATKRLSKAKGKANQFYKFSI